MKIAELIRLPSRKQRWLRVSRERLLAPFIIACILQSCASEPTRISGTARTTSAEDAVAMPPPGDLAIVNIVEKRFSNALQQEIFLSTSSSVPGQNVMSVQFFGTRNPSTYMDDPLAFIQMTESRIDSEMRGTLPGIRMVRSPLLVQNDYGAFGYAFGRASDTELCMYGWQQIRSPSGSVSPLANYGAIHIRVRLCETGATEDKLLSFMYGFSITGSLDDPGWNPYGTPAPVSDRLGRTGEPIYPPSAGRSPLQESGISPIPSVAAREARPARPARAAGETRQPAAPAPSPATEPATLQDTRLQGIVVPSPTSIQSGSARVPSAATTATAESPSQVIVPRPATAASQTPAIRQNRNVVTETGGN